MYFIGKHATSPRGKTTGLSSSLHHTPLKAFIEESTTSSSNSTTSPPHHHQFNLSTSTPSAGSGGKLLLPLSGSGGLNSSGNNGAKPLLSNGSSSKLSNGQSTESLESLSDEMMAGGGGGRRHSDWCGVY